MAVFTRVTEPELISWLDDYSLGQLLELQGVASGIENTNYFVTTSNGRFVLTLFEKLAASELPFYLNLMSHLARHGIPCPSPVANRHNQFLSELNGKPACIVSRLSGKSLMNPEVIHCAAIGGMLGRLHNAARSFAETMPNAHDAVWRTRAAQQVTPFLSPQDAALLESEVAFHGKHTLAALPQGVIHADLFRDNVLFDGARIGGLIDFYFACNDSLLYDVAITVNDWCMGADSILDKARTQALLQAYHEVRPMQKEEHIAWPIALRAAALRFWLSRLYDMHLPRENELIHAHNPDQFKCILQRHIAANSNVIWL
ncbi:homoserine kinase [Candidatus Nitrotoga sp. 1052]|uniref:homoserine kinase n=1 Tax=Candidatus Nitrotoga sp. 1052 TaxID=2886964 RepID=UPI001EF5DBA7|nr:homoserine kinase [Candidatus Nitrotoga sp. 1052]CAH1076137.1 Homoserine kinase [Candidatus Nitrotoga sp. 1052]